MCLNTWNQILRGSGRVFTAVAFWWYKVHVRIFLHKQFRIKKNKGVREGSRRDEGERHTFKMICPGEETVAVN